MAGINSYVRSVILIVITAGAALAGILKCRHCDSATHLHDCESDVLCDATFEECFMEKLVTNTSTIIFNAGCRSKEVCKTLSTSGASVIGRARRLTIPCSFCCSTDRCNSRLCGIPSASNDTQCFTCGLGVDTRQSDVYVPDKCVSYSMCPKNQMCFAQTSVDPGGQTIYRYGCYSAQICKILVQKTLSVYDRCEGTHDVDYCGTGKKKRTESICSVCCGSDGCNQGTCAEIRLRLYYLHKSNVLDYNTLKQNGSLPTGVSLPP